MAKGVRNAWARGNDLVGGNGGGVDVMRGVEMVVGERERERLYVIVNQGKNPPV